MIKKLINLADKLDEMGLQSHASYLDNIIKKAMDEDSYSDEDTELDDPDIRRVTVPPMRLSYESPKPVLEDPIVDTVPQERFNRKGPREHRRSLRDFFPGYEGDRDLREVTMKDIMYPDDEGAHPAGRYFVNDLSKI